MFKKVDFINDFGLEGLDEDCQDIINKMQTLSGLKNYFYRPNISTFESEGYTAQTAVYNQNYIIMKLLLKLQEQNDTLVKQNNQIIELLTEIKNK